METRRLGGDRTDLAEWDLEATYQARLSFNWLSVQLDVQFVVHPDTNPAVASALGVDLRVSASFLAPAPLPIFDFDRGASYISILSFEERAMNPKARGWLVLLAALTRPGAAPADTHAIVISTRVYQDQKTSVTFDYWVGADRSCRWHQDHHPAGPRDRLDHRSQHRTYTVSPIEKSGPLPPPRKPDRRKLWLDSMRLVDPGYRRNKILQRIRMSTVRGDG